jgi:hypothetical protein
MVWCGSVVLLLLLPITSRAGGVGSAVCLSLVYVVWSSVWAYVFGCRLRGRAKVAAAVAPDAAHLGKFLSVLAVTAVLGLIALAYDRVMIQRVDLSGGIARARYAWFFAGEERLGGISSVYSFIGNLLWPCSYVVLTAVVLGWERLKGRRRLLLLLCSVATITLTSALNGGRTPTLLAGAAVISVCLTRATLGLRLLPAFSITTRQLVAMTGACVLAYFPYVAIQRSEATRQDARDYATGILYFGHGQWTSGVDLVDSLPETVSVYVYPVLLSGVQWVHPFLVLQSVIENPERSGSVLLSTPLSLVSKVSVPLRASSRGMTAEWTYTGAFLSLPGALYHDLGFFGIFFGGILHGALLGRCELLVRRQRVSLRGFCFIVAVLSVTILAPLIDGQSLAPFPFMVFAFLVASPFCKSLVTPGPYEGGRMRASLWMAEGHAKPLGGSSECPRRVVAGGWQ